MRSPGPRQEDRSRGGLRVSGGGQGHYRVKCGHQGRGGRSEPRRATGLHRVREGGIECMCQGQGERSESGGGRRGRRVHPPGSGKEIEAGRLWGRAGGGGVGSVRWGREKEIEAQVGDEVARSWGAWVPPGPGDWCKASGARCTVEAETGEVTGNEKSEKKKGEWVTRRAADSFFFFIQVVFGWACFWARFEPDQAWPKGYPSPSRKLNEFCYMARSLVQIS